VPLEDEEEGFLEEVRRSFEGVLGLLGVPGPAARNWANERSLLGVILDRLGVPGEAPNPLSRSASLNRRLEPGVPPGVRPGVAAVAGKMLSKWL
jgi:hypothetical protein